jgi:hypothetical protein
MFTLLPILARSDESDLTKIIVGIVFVALWGLGALISAWNKKVEEERKRRQMGRLPKGLSRTPYTPPPQPVLYPPAPPPPRTKQKRRRQPAFVPPPTPEAQPVAVQAATPQPAPAAGPSRSQSTAATEPSRIAQLVHRKDSLRAALILQEVLSPPLGLRDSPP